MTIYVYGAGGHGKVVADALLSAGETVDGFIDDAGAPGRKVLGLTVCGDGRWLRSQNGARVALAVGDNRARGKLLEMLRGAGLGVMTVVHPRAVVAPSARVGAGAVVLAGAVLNADCWVHEGVIVNTASVVEHDVVVGPFAHVAPGATLGGGSALGAWSMLGTRGVVLPGIRVGVGAIVGAGAVVISDLDDGVVAVGVPARVRGHLQSK